MKIYRTMEGSETLDQNGKVTALEIQYFVMEGGSRRDAMLACLEDAPAEEDSLKKSGVRFDSVDQEGNYEIAVLYKQGSGSYSTEKEMEQMSFSCGGGTKHITHSRKQEILQGEKDPGGAIGWNGKFGAECTIAGVDIPCADLKENHTVKMKASQLSVAFRKRVASLVGKVNSSNFKGWEPGEVMFLDMSYQTPATEDEDVDVTFSFMIQPNENNVKLGDNKVSKQGFQYVWALSETVTEEGKLPTLKTTGIYRETVCEEADFKVLGV